MSNLNFRKRRNRRGFFFHLSRHLPTFIVLFVIALVLGGGIFAFSHFVLKQKPGSSYEKQRDPVCISRS